jgi:hypothetical protein
VDFACIPATLGYNGGMKQETKNELALAALATSPIVLILGVIFFYNLPSWV